MVFMIGRYLYLVAPILSNLYKVDSVTIQQCIIECILHITAIANNNHSLWTTLSLFEQSRTVLPHKQRVISLPTELLKLFLKVISVQFVPNSFFIKD